MQPEPTTPTTADASSGATTRSPAPPRKRPHPVFWVIAASLVMLTVRAWTPPGVGGDPPAFAQTTGGAGARGVFAFSGELSKGVNGVWMVDTDTMTIWAYEYNAQKGCLRLAASRTWRYDRYLENFNGCDLPPAEVERMIEQQRQYRLDAAEPEKQP